MKGTVKHTLSLELSRGGIQARVPVRQGDALVHEITVVLKNEGAPFRPTGIVLAQIYALLPSGDTVSCDGVILSDGKVRFIPGGGFFSCGGPVICRLSLRGGDGGELYSPAFAIDVDPFFAAGAEAVPAKEYSRLEELLLEVLEIEKNCKDTADEIRENIAISFGNEPPMQDGDAAAGTSALASRSDHVHPTDTSRMPAVQSMKISASVENSDHFVFYSQSEGSMKKMLWGRMLALIKQAVSSASGNMNYVGTALSITPLSEGANLSQIFVEPGIQIIATVGTVADYKGITYLYNGSEWMSIKGNQNAQAVNCVGAGEAASGNDN